MRNKGFSAAKLASALAAAIIMMGMAVSTDRGAI